MYLLVTLRAVLKTRRAQVMQRRSHCSQIRARRRIRHRKIRVTFHADEPHVSPRQHPRIRRPVRLMARAAPFEPHRSVVERKRPHLIAVTLGAGPFVGPHRLNRARRRRAMRVVAIDAAHCAFRQTMLVWLLKARPNIGMARRALLIDLDRFARDQSLRSVLVNCMARGTTHLVFRMAAVETSDMSALVQMTGEAQTICLGGLQFRRLPDAGRASRFRMFASGPVTRFACFRGPATLFVGLDGLMWVL